MADTPILLHERHYHEIKAVLAKLRLESSARVVFLVDKDGQQIAAQGEVGNLDTTSLASLVAGNVATPEGVRDLAEAGADAVKVGVGSGSICITRIVTGFGVPQLTAIAECAEAGRKLSIPIIADGGIRNSGDIAKSIAAGASTVMLGSLLAGTDQSPGAAVIRNGRRYKVVRGMASLMANVARKEVERQAEIEPDEWVEVVPEGVEAVVPYRGSVNEILHQLVGGLRSGMSYCGAITLEELYEKAEFIRITAAGREESGVHDVNVL